MRLRRGVVGSVIAVPTVILLAACGSTSKSSSATSTTNASVAVTTTVASTTAPVPTTTTAASANFSSCSVVTPTEASSAIGESVSAGVLGNATVEGGFACVFYGPSAPSPRTPNVPQPDTVRVVVVKGSDALRWYNDYKSKVAAQPITGYGDQAFYDGYASLSVLKGDSYLRIAISPPHATPSLSAEEKLATVIVSKL
jgi:hypothetical protein